MQAATCVNMGWDIHQYRSQPPGFISDIEMIIEERNKKQSEEIETP